MHLVATVTLVLLLMIYHSRRRDLSARLARSELRYRTLAQETADLILLIGASRTSSYVSPAIVELLGYTAAEVGALSIRTLVHPADRKDGLRRLRRLSRETPRGQVTVRLCRKDGAFLWAEATLCRIEQVDGTSETIITIRNVSERQHESEELRRATLIAQNAQADADRASKAKSDFLANMSHEIRTPLNSVIGFASLLLDTPELSPPARLNVERIQAAGKALLTVVNDILDFSQVEAGALELKPEPFSLPALIDECLSIVRQSARDKNLSLRVNIAACMPQAVQGDVARIRQVLLNLLNNSIKFTEEGSVLLDIRYDSSSRAANRIKFSIIDTGIGIAPGESARLFQRFAQVDSSVRRSRGGSGLGLAICKGLVELMQGEIGLESEKDVGSTFWFSLPLRQATLVTRVENPSASVRPRRRQILLVEDVRINQELARLILEGSGHTVDIVGNGAEAVMAVQDKAYDVVLMDIQMPHVDGLTATRMIRDLAHPSSMVPIVALTANVLPEQAVSARNAGIHDVIRKPFTPDELRAALDHVFDGASVPGPRPTGSADVETLAKLCDLIGDAKVRSLLASFLASLAQRFKDDPRTREGRTNLARQAHASVGGSGMLGFTSFASACRALEAAEADEVEFFARLTDLKAEVAAVTTSAEAWLAGGGIKRRSNAA